VQLAHLVVVRVVAHPRARGRASSCAWSRIARRLTQTAIGLSRDDVEGRFPGVYANRGIVDRSPFETIDAPGVGELVRVGAERGLKTNPALKLGVCGEHGGDPTSIEFFDEIGLDYVSCSPTRIPVARLAAAQVVLARDDAAG
jgi:pyruvate,orthophosphate dikinase